MARKGMNIYKRKDGRWEGRYQVIVDGTLKYKSVYAKTYRHAREKLIERKKISCHIRQNNFYNEDNYSFNDVCDMWLSSIQNSLKESTYSIYSFYVKKHFNPYWASKKIRNVTEKDIAAFIDNKKYSRTFHGETLSDSSVKTIYYITQAVLNYAFQNNLVPIFRIPQLKIKKDFPKVAVIYRNEQTILENYIRDNPSPRTIGILLSLHTGIRIGELCALRWKDIDLNEGYVNICQTLQRIQSASSKDGKTKVIISEPKSKKSRRTIPLSGSVIDFLNTYYPPCPENAFFLTGRADRFIEPRVYSFFFKQVLKQCHLKDINFHACRHTFATRCIETGADPKTVSELLGHTTVAMTLNKYVHSNFELQKKAVNLLDVFGEN